MLRTTLAETLPRVPLPIPDRADEIFPTLTAAQIARLAAHGRIRLVAPGEVLLEAGAKIKQFFVVTAGGLEVIRRSAAGEELITVERPGQFTGEVSMLSGRPGLVTCRAVEAAEVIEISRDQLAALVQTDSELSDILMRAFILRRANLIARGMGDAVLVGSTHSSGTLRIKEFLTRNGHPYTYMDLDKDAGVQDLLDRFRVSEDEVPVVICRGSSVLRDPTNG